MLVSVLIPAYNEEKTLRIVVEKVIENLNKKFPFEIIIVDDGSKDDTPKIGKKLQHEFNNVIYHRNSRNLGKTGAIKVAISKSKGDVLIIQDADMEYDPKYLYLVLFPVISKKVDVCFGSRFLGSIHGMKKSHVFGNRFLTISTSLLYPIKTTDMETGYKAFTRDIISKINFKGKGFELEPYISIQVARLKCKFGEVPIEFNARKFGEKKITWFDGFQAFKIIIFNIFTKSF